VHWNRAATSRLVKVSYKTLLTKIAERELSLFANRGTGTTVNMRPAEIAFYRALKLGSPLIKEVGDRTRTHDAAAERVAERTVEGDGPAPTRLAAIVITAKRLG